MLKAILINDTRTDRHHGCSAVVDTIETLCRANGISIIERSVVHDDWRLNPNIAARSSEADIFIVNGEGTIHHDRAAAKTLVAVGAYARTLGKPAVLINATWHANSAELAEKARSFNLISVRETESLRELAGHGINARVVPDLALYRPIESMKIRTGIGYTDSVVGTRALDLHRHMVQFNAEPASILFGRRSWRDVAVSLRRFLPGSTALNPRMLAAALRGAAIDWNSQFDDSTDFANWVGSKSLIVTGRFHMMMLAFSARTPVLVVGSNTSKNEATLNDAGLASWRSIAVAEIDGDLLTKAQHWHGDELRRLDAFVENGRKEIDHLFADIRQIAA